MKKNLTLLLVLLFSISMFGCASQKVVYQGIAESQEKQAPQITEVNKVMQDQKQIDENEKKAVTTLVEDFGKRLQMVSLLAPKDILFKSMKDSYGGLVSPLLLEKWQSDPQNAPGRMVSSPWPDRIEIQSVEKSADETYVVKGEIIEITSVEQEHGGVAAKRPISLVVKKIENSWLIDAVTLGAYEEIRQVTYENTQYGFSFSLPASWKGYTIVTDK